MGTAPIRPAPSPGGGRHAFAGRRINVIGTSGSGKTTVAAELAGRLGIPHIMLDALRFGPRWRMVPDDEFRRRVEEAVAGDAWVLDGNYADVRDVVWPRATTVVWVDYERPQVMRQVIRRSVESTVRRRELFSGNRERVRDWLKRDHPVWWAWSQHGHNRRREEAALADPRWSHLEVVRLRSPEETQAWLESAAP